MTAPDSGLPTMVQVRAWMDANKWRAIDTVHGGAVWVHIDDRDDTHSVLVPDQTSDQQTIDCLVAMLADYHGQDADAVVAEMTDPAEKE